MINSMKKEEIFTGLTVGKNNSLLINFGKCRFICSYIFESIPLSINSHGGGILYSKKQVILFIYSIRNFLFNFFGMQKNMFRGRQGNL